MRLEPAVDKPVLRLIGSTLLILMLSVARVGAQTRTPTTHTSIGLFYQPKAPQITVLRKAGDDGEPLNLRGRSIGRIKDLSDG